MDYFRQVGVPLSEAYGLSETSGVVFVETASVKVGSIGRPTPGCEVRILDDGEICCRGGNVFPGYYRDPERTAEVLDADGWFRTGDVGAVDDEGYLRLLDRKKELIITAGGKNISPANIEAALKQIPLIGQACVIGDSRPYLTALLVLDPASCTTWAQENGCEDLTMADLAQHPAVAGVVEAGLDEVNSRLSQVEQIKKLRLLATEWLPDSECLTPTMKLKRRGVHARYAAEIDALYSGASAVE
ncbi:MAG: AMP-binding protein [Actinophytocola sp.]|nr:AMP-binding protein [Actinophytocola sp.]